MVTLEVDFSQLDEFGPKMPEVRKVAMNRIALDMQRTVDELSPIDEGLLHKWYIAEQSDSKVVIKTPAKYAGFVNYGTSPHFIRPKSKKGLHWTGSMNMSISGNNISLSGSKGGFSKGHMVGGIAGRHFVEKAIKEVNARTDDHFKAAIAEVLG